MSRAKELQDLLNTTAGWLSDARDHAVAMIEADAERETELERLTRRIYRELDIDPSLSQHEVVIDVIRDWADGGAVTL